MSEKSRLLVFANSSESHFPKFNELLSSVLEPNKYTVENLQRNQLTSENLNEKCAALFLLDCERSLDDECREIVSKFVFGPTGGKAMLFCDLNRNPSNELWLLNKGFKENKSIPDVVDLFQKFVKREDIPVNRQAVQLTGVESDDEFTVALARVENAVEYLCASAESGSEAVFVASTADHALQQTKAVWSDLANALNLETVSVKPQPRVESLAATPETVYVYTGRLGEDIERFEKFDEAVKLLLKPNSFKYSHLDQTRLSSDINLLKICKALLMAPATNQEFNEKSRKNLLNYFAGGGKVMFFGDFKTDPDWLWFLKYSFKDEQILSRIFSAFEKFVKGDRIPTNLQALQLPTDGKIVNEYSVAFIRVENTIPLLYLSCENGSTAAFAAASPQEVMEQNLTVWKDLLRIIDVIIFPGQDHRFTFNRMLSRVEDDTVRKSSPNLFVYNGAQEDPKEFEKFYKIFKTALRRDTYAIYPLSHKFISAMPWMPYCRALFVSTEKSNQINADVRKMMESYFKQGGKLMFFCDLKCDPDALWFLKSAITDDKLAKDVHEGFQRFDKTGLMPVNLTGKQVVKGSDTNVNEQYLAMMRIENAVSILYLATDTGSTVAFAAGEPEMFLNQNVEVWKDILRVLDMDVSTNVQPALTSGYLVCKDKDWQSQAFDLLKSPKETSQDILFVKTSPEADSPTFPLRLVETHKDFDKDEYFKTLKTRLLGCVSVFIPVARSLLPIASSLHTLVPSLDIVVMAQQQTAGEGGYKKQWISPPGAALFSFVTKIPRKSNLGNHISFMNQLTTSAVVAAIKSTTIIAEAVKGSDFSVGIKWPNDVYVGKDIKIGGVISSAVESGSDFLVTVGIGVNVSNHRPTACLNDFVPENILHFKIETIIATILNHFETSVAEAQSKGLKNIISSFETNCVNMNQEVVLYKTKEKGVVVGINESGHLKVKLHDGRVVPVTFDASLDLRLNCFDCLVPV